MIEWDEKFEPTEDRTPVTRSHPEEISGRCKRRAVGGVAVGNLEVEMGVDVENIDFCSNGFKGP